MAIPEISSAFGNVDDPHYHAWTLRQVTIEYWPGPISIEHMAYVADAQPFRVRQTAANHLPRYDANLDYGSMGGQVLKCDGGPGCPWRLHQLEWARKLEAPNGS